MSFEFDLTSRPFERFGELLAREVSLTRHDIDEVLAEQRGTRKRFGQVALQMGLCLPGNVWNAWSTQLVGRTPWVDLNQHGIDAQATAELDAWMATSLGVVPMRVTDDVLIVATDESALPHATQTIHQLTKKQVRFVLAHQRQIEAALRQYYSPLCLSAVRAGMFDYPCDGPVASQRAAPRCQSKCSAATCAGERCKRSATTAESRGASKALTSRTPTGLTLVSLTHQQVAVPLPASF